MATASGPVEIDAVFVKALKLLHSRHPDSLDQLRALRDDAIRQHSQQVPSAKTIKVSLKETSCKCRYRDRQAYRQSDKATEGLLSLFQRRVITVCLLGSSLISVLGST